MTARDKDSAYPLPITSEDNFSFTNLSLDDALEDLSSRFILNIPEWERQTIERVGFQIENAHWYYEDFVREENTTFPSVNLRRFYAMLWKAVPLLHEWHHSSDEALDRFMQYKQFVPVCGAIMLNEACTKVVLVKGWKAAAGWGFPKGKINQSEPKPKCAAREVLEETGYDIKPLLKAEDEVTCDLVNQLVTLYIIHPVPEDTQFVTRTRKEISRIEWFPLAELPGWTKTPKPGYKFFHIQPFMRELKRWIGKKKREMQVQAYEQNVARSSKRNRRNKKKQPTIAKQSGQGEMFDAEESDTTQTEEDEFEDEDDAEVLAIDADEPESNNPPPAAAPTERSDSANSQNPNYALQMLLNAARGSTPAPRPPSSAAFTSPNPRSQSAQMPSSTTEFSPLALLRRHSGLDEPRTQSPAVPSDMDLLMGVGNQNDNEVQRRARILLDSLAGDKKVVSSPVGSPIRTPPHPHTPPNRVSYGTPPPGVYRQSPISHSRQSSIPPDTIMNAPFSANNGFAGLPQVNALSGPNLPGLGHGMPPFNANAGHLPGPPGGVIPSIAHGGGPFGLQPPSLPQSQWFGQPPPPPLPQRGPLDIGSQPNRNSRQYHPLMPQSMTPLSTQMGGPSFPPRLIQAIPGGVIPSRRDTGTSQGDNEKTPRASLLQPPPPPSSAPALGSSPLQGSGPNWRPATGVPRNVPHASQLLKLFSDEPEDANSGSGSAWSG